MLVLLFSSDSYNSKKAFYCPLDVWTPRVKSVYVNIVNVR